ncbi:MAG: hypothetical protein ACMG57_03415 [Candidatus Dojkabacteria bacterium]
MKNFFDKIKAQVDRVRNYLKTLTFRNVVILIVGALLVLGILNLLFLPKTPDTILVINDNQTITDGTGKVVSFYNSYDNEVSKGSGNYVTIYVNDLKNITGAQIKDLVARVLAKKGLKASNTSVSIKQMTDVPTEGNDLSNNQTFDPTDPSTFVGKAPDAIGYKYSTEPTDTTSLSDFVANNPAGSELYSILKVSDNKYTVILKNGYTEAQFRKDILSGLTDGNQAQLEFIDIFKYKETVN